MIRKKLLKAAALSTAIVYTAQQYSDKSLFKIHAHASHHVAIRTVPFRYFSATARHRFQYNSALSSPHIFIH